MSGFGVSPGGGVEGSGFLGAGVDGAGIDAGDLVASGIAIGAGGCAGTTIGAAWTLWPMHPHAETEIAAAARHVTNAGCRRETACQFERRIGAGKFISYYRCRANGWL